MKNSILIFIFGAVFNYAHGQTTTTTLLSSPAGFKFRSVITVDSRQGDFLDTTNIYFHPEQWADTANFRAYLLQLIASCNERQEDLTREILKEKDQEEFYKSSMNAIFGPSAFLSAQSQYLLDRLQGSWFLVEKGEKTSLANVDNLAISSGSKIGTIVPEGNNKFVVQGLFPFSLLFERQENGNFKAVKQAGNKERVFFLRR